MPSKKRAGQCGQTSKQHPAEHHETEIHTYAALSRQFVGGIHRQLETRRMTVEGITETDRCIPQPSVSGVLRVTPLVFNVILDDTAYTLTVPAQQGKPGMFRRYELHNHTTPSDASSPVRN